MARKQIDRSDSDAPSPALSLLAASVHARRKHLRLTQETLAELAGCSSRFVRQLEGGKGTVRLDKVEAVLRALGLELRAMSRTVS